MEPEAATVQMQMLTHVANSNSSNDVFILPVLTPAQVTYNIFVSCCGIQTTCVPIFTFNMYSIIFTAQLLFWPLYIATCFDMCYHHQAKRMFQIPYTILQCSLAAYKLRTTMYSYSNALKHTLILGCTSLHFRIWQQITCRFRNLCDKYHLSLPVG
jgi:hypothetical protein